MPPRPQSKENLKSFGKGSWCPRLSKGVLRLYSMRFCPHAQRTRLVLEHKKIPYETVNVKLYDDKPDWLMNKNPFGHVPILEKDGHIIYGTTSTCEWLDDVFTDFPPKLMPGDPDMKAKDRALFESLETLSERFFRIAFKPEPVAEYPGGPFSLPRTFQNLLFNPRVREVAIPILVRNLKRYEAALEERGGVFFGGLEPSLLDFYLWPDMERVPSVVTCMKCNPREVISKAQFPRLNLWVCTMSELPAVKATKMGQGSHTHYYRTLAEGNPDYDFRL